MSDLHTIKHEGSGLIYDGNSGYLFEVDTTVFELACGNLETEDPIVDQARKRLQMLNKLSIAHARRNELTEADRNSLSSLWLNVSHTCNLKCEYCFANDGTYGEKGIMTDGIAKQSVDYLFQHGKPNPAYRIVFFGGEPLINFGVIKECILYGLHRANELNAKVNFHVITNGTLITPYMAHFLRLHGATVQLSIDGPMKEHDRLRRHSNGDGSYCEVVKGLHILAEAGFTDISARVTITHYNCNVVEIVKHLDKLGFSSVSLIPVMINPKSEYALTDQDLNRIKQEYQWLADEVILQLRESGSEQLGVFEKTVKRIAGKKKKRHFCGAGYDSLVVTPSGTVYPCHRIASRKGLECGVIIEQIGFLSQESHWGALSVEKKEPCRNCWARYLCGGGCATSGFEKYGTFSKPNDLECELLKAVIGESLRIYYVLSSRRNLLPQQFAENRAPHGSVSNVSSRI